MDPIEQLLAERACRRLLLDLVRSLDLDEPASVADLFTEDGTWTWPEGDRRITGRAALRAHFDSRPAAERHTRSRSLMSSVHVEVTSPDTATATSYFTTFRVDDHDRSATVGAGPGPGAGLGLGPGRPRGEPPAPPAAEPDVRIGHYEDTLRRTPDGTWLLAARTLFLPRGGPAPLL
ncbi:nuclear transport factor 2 family protein [Streptomyces antibioticus]|uniref:nuclear transport factor 2 family protein n=1 Tax=Streptomyces antibioticus TaxID=1890 RepID=UPI00339E71B2